MASLITDEAASASIRKVGEESDSVMAPLFATPDTDRPEEASNRACNPAKPQPGRGLVSYGCERSSSWALERPHA